MKYSDLFRIEMTLEYGAIVECSNVEIADEFDDFISEDYGETSSLKFEDGKTTFYFEFPKSVADLTSMVEIFLEKIR